MSLLTSVLTQGDTGETLGLLEQFRGLFTAAGLPSLLRSAVVILTGFPLTLLLSRWTRRLVGSRYSPQQGMVAGKVVLYAGVLVLLVSVLMELGFSLAPLLGAAGILGIALGFAAQTSVSNIISGFFLMAEQPFVVDDLIQVSDLTGRVLSIDVLSVKLRTYDNRFVRIPNEDLVKTAFLNLTRFPIRRADIPVGVAYKENVARVREILFQVAREHPEALMEPEPQFFFQDYGPSSLDFLFGVWVSTERYFEVRNELRETIKERFDEEGIEIPFPHRTLYAGAVTEPFPIRVVGDLPPGAPGTLPDSPAGPASPTGPGPQDD